MKHYKYPSGIRPNVMSPIRRVGGAVVDVSGGQEGDRETILQISSLHLFFFHFLFSIHITSSPQMYHQDIMVPLCSLFLPPLLFTSCLFLLTWAWRARLICHTFESLHGLALLSPGL